MRWGRWIDHLPLWAAWGATVSTGIYDPGECALMALPLLAAVLVEALRWDFSRRQRWLEFGALCLVLGHLSQGRGLFTVAIHTLFVLGGVRLVLPRELFHRRQLLLMSFMLLLTTALATTDVLFLLGVLVWFMCATLALLQQSWEGSANLRRGAPSPPPYARVPLWVGLALLLGSGFFLLMPRLTLGLRPRLFLGASRAFGQAGMGDQLDLSGGGPIEPNPEVALRITPPAGIDPTTKPGWSHGLELLRGITLEDLHGLRWEPSRRTPGQGRLLGGGPTSRQAEFFFTPSTHGILVLPLGVLRMEPLTLPLVEGAGATICWQFPRAQSTPVTVIWNPVEIGTFEPRMIPHRAEFLTRLEPIHDAARRASFRFAPDIQSTPQLAHTLETALRGFTYTLDNPSGKAANPLEDFLERSRAGHCEYFASAMALMLRARGVPARVVNGYRLGPWIPEGGYFRVSQNEAHSWVEYWYEGRWWTADPTPLSSSSAASGDKGLGAFARWFDAVRYRWDRYVVRFSDQDQLNGLSWIQSHFQDWEWHWKAPPRTVTWPLGFVVLAWLLWRTRGQWQPLPQGPGRIRALRPLLKATRRTLPPQTGETARAWLRRLGALRPERMEALCQLADAVDVQAYGAGSSAAPVLAKAEAAVWRVWRSIPS